MYYSVDVLDDVLDEHSHNPRIHHWYHDGEHYSWEVTPYYVWAALRNLGDAAVGLEFEFLDEFSMVSEMIPEPLGFNPAIVYFVHEGSLGVGHREGIDALIRQYKAEFDIDPLIYRGIVIQIPKLSQNSSGICVSR